MTIQYFHSNHRMSQVTVHKDTVYLAGQVASDPSADVRGQTEQILKGIDNLLAEAGTSKENVLSATIWLTDMSTFAEMNAVWDAWVVPGRTPVRACVESNLAGPAWKVEIMVIAALPE